MLKYFVALISLIAAGAFHSFGSRVQRPLVKSSLSMYAVRIVNNKKNTDFTIGIPPGAIILDYAETQGYSIPYSCRAGSCSSCIGIMKSGEVDQTGQIFLSDQQVGSYMYSHQIRFVATV